MAQPAMQDFDTILGELLVDINGDGVPDVRIPAPQRNPSRVPPPPPAPVGGSVRGGGVLEQLREQGLADPAPAVAEPSGYFAQPRLPMPLSLIQSMPAPTINNLLRYGGAALEFVGEGLGGAAPVFPPAAGAGAGLRTAGRTLQSLSQTGRAMTEADDAILAASRMADAARAQGAEVPTGTEVFRNLAEQGRTRYGELMTSVERPYGERYVSDLEYPASQLAAEARYQQRVMRNAGAAAIESRAAQAPRALPFYDDTAELQRQFREQDVARRYAEQQGRRAEVSNRLAQPAEPGQQLQRAIETTGRTAQDDAISSTIARDIGFFVQIDRLNAGSGLPSQTERLRNNLGTYISELAQRLNVPEREIVRVMQQEGYDLSSIGNSSFQGGVGRAMSPENQAVRDMIRGDSNVLSRNREYGPSEAATLFGGAPPPRNALAMPPPPRLPPAANP